MKQNKAHIIIPLALALVMVMGMFIGFKLKEKTNASVFFEKSSNNALQEAIRLIEEKYVDNTNADSLTQIAIEKILEGLDPHSVYIPPTLLKQANEELQGSFLGVGIEFLQINDTICISYVASNGPSEKAGCKIGDQIIALDTVLVSGKKLSTDFIRKTIRNYNKKVLPITLLRNGKQILVNITKESIPVSVIDAAYMLDSSVGLIRINKFADRTYEEFMQNLEMLQKKGMQSLIVDVRSNGGGLLSEAVAIADEFLDNDKLIVYTNGTNTEKYEYRCKKDGLFETGKLAVLIDETSASASEVLAGALQDWDRATIIGRRSFGKGLVQQQYNLSNGGAIRLTTARYYTPLGRNIQKEYTHKSKEEYEKELSNRITNNTLLQADTIHTTKAYKTPKGNTVYGGGGITPTIYSAYDTTKMSTNLHKILSSPILSNYIYATYLQKQNTLSKLATVQQLLTAYQPSTNEIEAITKKAAASGITISNLNKEEMDYLAFHLQALMARQIFRTKGYFEVINKKDATLKKALDNIK